RLVNDAGRQSLGAPKHFSNDRVNRVGCSLEAAHDIAESPRHLIQVRKYLAALLAHFGCSVLYSKTQVALSYSGKGFLDLNGPVLNVLCGQAVVALNRRPLDRGLVRITHDFAAR